MYKKVAFAFRSIYNYSMKFFEGLFSKKLEEPQKPQRPGLETQGAWVDPNQEIKIDLSQFPDLSPKPKKENEEPKSMVGFSRDTLPTRRPIPESDSDKKTKEKEPEKIMFSSQAQKAMDEVERRAAEKRELLL